LLYQFKNYALDTDRRELRRGADLIALAPQVFDLLEYLIRNRDNVVTKDDLISAIWNGRVVSDAALTTRLNAARTAIGDTGKDQQLIKTLPRKGFRFVGSVHEQERQPIATVHGNGGVTPSISTPPLSIVVLPFANIGGDPEQEYFVDGVTESLTTDLSRVGGLFVVARNSAFSYKGKAIDARQVGRELNVRYVLEGSVQRSGSRLRVNVQMVDAGSGNHIWAERFDKPVADLFDMQDEIVSRLTHPLGVQIIGAEARRAERSAHPDAVDLIFQGFARVNKGQTPEYLAQARCFFERALAIDPRSIGALVGIAMADAFIAGNLLGEDRALRCAAAETNAVQALSLGPNYAMAHLTLGVVYMLTNRAAQGISEFEHALKLDRNLAEAHGCIGLAKIFIGRAEETEGHVREALRISPRDVSIFRWTLTVGAAKIHLGADAEAIVWLRESIEANRNVPTAHFWLAAALALSGAVDEARAAARAGLALNPGYTIRRQRLGASSDNSAYLSGLERFCEGIRVAGVPEG
jgi:TolB-like protein/tetratricopeptide (TPR) repeat protein